MSISKVRNSLSSLVTQVAMTKEPVVIIRESSPLAIIQPFKETINDKDYLKKLLSIKGDWFEEKEYKQVRKEVEERVKKLHNEKSSSR